MTSSQPRARLTLKARLATKWRHRKVTNAGVRQTRVDFDRMLEAGFPDPPKTFDDVNERTRDYYTPDERRQARKEQK